MRRNLLTLLWVGAMLFSYYAVKAAEHAELRKHVVRSGVVPAPKGGRVVPPGEERAGALVQVALLLDTSNSMDGLIEQARTQLWDIVNELASAKHRGKPARLQVALFEYGNDRIPAGEGHIRMVLPFTTDLDKVSEELFALRTNGGSEYCGQVIAAAANGLGWSKSAMAIKSIYIAGNEPFTQGSVDYHNSCRAAIARGITLNTIYCGQNDTADADGWRDGSRLGDGAYASIDHTRPVAMIETPYDRQLAALNGSLNSTYVPYGRAAAPARARQQAQDSNAAACSPSMAAARVSAKASVQYDNSRWDLVDALRPGGRGGAGMAGAAMPASAELPAEMQRMGKAEREAYVQGKTRERARLQAEIRALSAKRARYLAGQRAKGANEATLGRQMTRSLRAQGAKKGFSF